MVNDATELQTAARLSNAYLTSTHEERIPRHDIERKDSDWNQGSSNTVWRRGWIYLRVQHVATKNGSKR